MTQFRIKLVVRTDTTDAHYWLRDTIGEAIVLQKELQEDLGPDVDADVYIYAVTRHGHVRVH